MNCSECQELLVGYVERLLDRQEEQDVALHLQSCEVCQADLEALGELRARLVRDGKALAAKALDRRVMDRIREEQTKTQRRIKMIRRYKTRLSVAAASIAVMIGAVLILTVLDRTSTPAYALEQTLQANNGIRSIHLKEEKVDFGIRESWAEFGENGGLVHLRMEALRKDSGPDAPDVVVWQEDKAEIWHKARKMLFVIRAPDILAKLPDQFYGPKRVMKQLYEAQAQDKVAIEAREPPTEGECIELVATWSEPSGVREVYRVDPKTKLLQEVERYKAEAGGHVCVARYTFLEYNKPIDPAFFKLDVPADVARIDQTTQPIGLVKGGRTDEEIAREVVRQFFEAAIAGDYAKASQLYEGIPVAKLAEAFRQVRIVRIVSIGAPTRHPTLGSGFLRVPCEVEVQANGVKSTERMTPSVHPVHGQPDRWTISGGI